MQISARCYCGNSAPYSECCQPFHLNKLHAPNAEALMRSRFSAYVVENYHYILNTYGSVQRAQLSVQEIQQDAQQSKWLGLEVIRHTSGPSNAQVEFKAFYKVDTKFYAMHELSDFEQTNNQWFYTTGKMLAGTGEVKPQRNDPCLCKSGKKFKKCCGK